MKTRQKYISVFVLITFALLTAFTHLHWAGTFFLLGFFLLPLGTMRPLPLFVTVFLFFFSLWAAISEFNAVFLVESTRDGVLPYLQFWSYHGFEVLMLEGLLVGIVCATLRGYKLAKVQGDSGEESLQTPSSLQSHTDSDDNLRESTDRDTSGETEHLP